MATRDFPMSVDIGDRDFSFTLLTPHDRTAIAGLARSLPEEDKLFMRRDITHADGLDEWMRDLTHHRSVSIGVWSMTGKLVGYGSIHYNQTFWNRHIGELRTVIHSAYRTQELQRRLVAELYLIARDLELEKLIVYLPADDKPARLLIENLGFVPEALLTDWVKTRDNVTHDLVIMSVALG